jgi:flagellar hook-basal body complex protein FliE
MNIQGLNAISQGAGAREILEAAQGDAKTNDPARLEPATDGASFSDVLGKAIDQVASQQKTADAKVLEVMSGQSDDYAGMMVSIHRASLGLQLGLEVRNRVMDAYHEIMRMTV